MEANHGIVPSCEFSKFNRRGPINTRTLGSRQLFRGSTKFRLLVSALDSLCVPQSVLGIELDCDVMVGCTSIQSTALDASHVRHDFQLCIKRAATVAAEPVLVNLSRGAYGVIGLWLALCDRKVAAWDNNIGCIGCSSPFLAVSAMAQSCRIRVAWRQVLVCSRGYALWTIPMVFHMGLPVNSYPISAHMQLPLAMVVLGREI